MGRGVVVRYQTRDGQAEPNEALVRAVFDELARERPDGITYLVLRLETGEFVHVALTADGRPGLDRLAAFQEFQSGIGQRVTEAPAAVPATLVGAYGSFG